MLLPDNLLNRLDLKKKYDILSDNKNPNAVNMILTKDFVFIHFPKTGGKFVVTVLLENAPKEWEVKHIDQHPNIRDIPETHRHLPVFGFVRNPWDWYVSWYEYLKRDKTNEFFNKVSNNGAKNFKDTILTAFDADFIKKENIGGCTWYFEFSLGKDYERVRIGKFERLREDLLKILSGIVEVPDQLASAILSHPPVNTGKRGKYQDYYDQELRDIVATKDERLIKRFDYRFE